MADHRPDQEEEAVVRAAGAVVWRPSGPGAQVLLVHRPRYDDWSFAKGKLEPGEHVLAAAVREVAEETGLTVALGPRLPPVSYLAGRSPKRVDYWAATVASEKPFTAGHEVDEIAWLGAGSAAAALSYAHDVQTLAAFRGGAGASAATAPLVVLRHASAGSKSRWDGADPLRPLDSRGVRQAAVLAGLLRCFGIRRVVSAPAQRCVATLQPYARAAGLPVEVQPAFAMDGHEPPGAGSPAIRQQAARRAAGQLAAAPEPAVICAHRENLPQLLGSVCAQLGCEPPDGPPLRKAEFLVLHRAGGAVVASERYHADGEDGD